MPPRTKVAIDSLINTQVDGPLANQTVHQREELVDTQANGSLANWTAHRLPDSAKTQERSNQITIKHALNQRKFHPDDPYDVTNLLQEKSIQKDQGIITYFRILSENALK